MILYHKTCCLQANNSLIQKPILQEKWIIMVCFDILFQHEANNMHIKGYV